MSDVSQGCLGSCCKALNCCGLGVWHVGSEFGWLHMGSVSGIWVGLWLLACSGDMAMAWVEQWGLTVCRTVFLWGCMSRDSFEAAMKY
jgi:hypothetical protein